MNNYGAQVKFELQPTVSQRQNHALIKPKVVICSRMLAILLLPSFHSK